MTISPIFSENMKLITTLLIFYLFYFCLPHTLLAIEPDEVLVISNKNMAGSEDIAEYYRKQRSIPASHVLSLSLSSDETMTRQEYDTILSSSVRRTINNLQPQAQIRAIVLMYGVPLKVAPPPPSASNHALVDSLRNDSEPIVNTDNGQQQSSLKKTISEKINELLGTDQRAAVDSELALVKVKNYTLKKWMRNPFFIGFQNEDTIITKDQVLLVSRLDGPNIETVRRVIDDTVQTEQRGLQGIAYFDSRWPVPESSRELSGYRLYDASIHKAADVVKKRMKVVVDSKEALFEPHSCPKAALYCGWYSLGKYIDSFDWVPGSIGFHIASSECRSLKKENSSIWCLKMLEKGAAATIGPVYEPYVQGFPLPEIFYSFLVEGYMSLGEAYLVSLPYLSWQTVLVGDPLYQPFSPLD